MTFLCTWEIFDFIPTWPAAGDTIDHAILIDELCWYLWQRSQMVLIRLHRETFVIIRILKCTYKFKWSPSGLHPWTNSIFITYPILLNSFKSIFCHCRWCTAVRQTTSTATSGNLSLPLTNWMSQTDTVWVWQLLWGEPLHQPSISNIKSSDKNLGITFDKHLNLTYQSFSQLYVFNLKRCKNETFNGFQSFGSLSSTKL